MLIIVDVDDVSLQSMPAWLAFYNSWYDDNLRPSDITDWDMIKFVKPECGEKIYDILARPDFYASVLPVPGARRGVRTLRGQGHRILFVTAGFHPQKLFALQNHGLIGCTWEDMVDYAILHDKWLIRADAIIDDNVKTVLAFPGLRILYTRSWNKKAQGDFHRVRTWKEAVGVVSDHAVQKCTEYW